MNHLSPLIGLLGEELAEISRRANKHRAIQVGNSSLDLWIGEASIDLLVQLVDDLRGGILGAPNPKMELAS